MHSFNLTKGPENLPIMNNCFQIKSGKLYFRIILTKFFTSGTQQQTSLAHKNDQPWKITVRKRVFDVIMNLNRDIFMTLKLRGNRFPCRFICWAMHISGTDGGITPTCEADPDVIFHKCLLDYAFHVQSGHYRGKTVNFTLDLSQYQIWNDSG